MVLKKKRVDAIRLKLLTISVNEKCLLTEKLQKSVIII